MWKLCIKIDKRDADREQKLSFIYTGAHTNHAVVMLFIVQSHRKSKDFLVYTVLEMENLALYMEFTVLRCGLKTNTALNFTLCTCTS